MTRMLRLVDGMLYRGKPADEFQLTVHRLGNGHAEASVRRSIWWEEDKVATPEIIDLWAKQREESADERREANRQRGARRATTRVRRLVKVAGMDALLTLTYREKLTDLALCKKHLKEFNRRMRRLIPGWRWVAAFEKQDRGAWHVHMAIDTLPRELPASNGVKVKSYNIVRAVWRSVVGHDNGNIDQSRRRRHARSSAAKVAAYISKYMLKAFADGDAWSNRYSAGGLDALPAAQRVRFLGYSLSDMVQLAYDEIATGVCDCWPQLRKFGDVAEAFFLSVGPMRPSPGGGGV